MGNLLSFFFISRSLLKETENIDLDRKPSKFNHEWAICLTNLSELIELTVEPTIHHTSKMNYTPAFTLWNGTSCIRFLSF
jgi:hypothetical protein